MRLFFQIEIPHTTLRGVTNAAYNSRTQASQKHHSGATDLLAQIEELGWHLEHASWVYMQTGQNSQDKFLASGQQVVARRSSAHAPGRAPGSTQGGSSATNPHSTPCTRKRQRYVR